MDAAVVDVQGQGETVAWWFLDGLVVEHRVASQMEAVVLEMTLPVGLQRFFAENFTDWPGLMAASFMMSVPVVVLFLGLQRYFVRALTEGAVKH